MILAFEFYYISHNGVLEHLLKEIAVDFGISHKILKEDLLVTLYVEDEKDQLARFADYIAEQLPLSIFFKSTNVLAVEAIPERQEVLPPIKRKPLFTPKTLSAVSLPDSNFYLSPTVGAQGVNISLYDGDKKIVEANNATGYALIYQQIADLIASGAKVRIDTISGPFMFASVEAIKTDSTLSLYEIMPTDLSLVERMVVVRDNEIKALASLERPAIEARINAVYAQKEIISLPFVTVRLADDLFLLHLSRVLFEKGVHYLVKSKAGEDESTYKVEYDCKHELRSPLKITVLENGEMLILEGKDFASEHIVANLKKFADPAHATYASIIQEHHLFDEISSCFYLSKEHDTKIMSYSKEHGMLNLVNVELPKSFHELFEAIKTHSQSGALLVANYQKAYPELFESLLHVTIPELPKNVLSMWSISSVLLGIAPTLDTGSQTIMVRSSEYGGEKGTRIDYYLDKEESLTGTLNWIKFFRSGMSFKLAGADDQILSYGHMESLAYFMSDMADVHKNELGTTHIALGGSLFGFARFAQLANNQLRANFKVCFNRELPIDQTL